MPEILENEYTITPGTLVKGVTGFIIILFVLMATVIPYTIYFYEDEIFFSIMFLILMLSIFIPVLVGSWAYSPQKYVVSEKGLQIVRPINAISIPLKTIIKIEDREINPLKTIRLWGNGGVFSLSGSFYNKSDGKFWMYAKNNKFVMVHADKKYVISPDEKEMFMIELSNKIEKPKQDKDKRSNIENNQIMGD